MANKKAARPKKQPHWLNKKDMARSIGISVQAFDKWNIDPVARIGRETFYAVDDVLDFYVERELARLAPQDNQPGSDIEKQLLNEELPLKQRRDLLSLQKLERENHRLGLQNAVLEGRSLPAWGVSDVLSKILARAGEVFDGIPLKIKRKLPKTDKRVIEMIKAELVKVQNEVARLDEYTEEIIDKVVGEAEERIR